MAKYLVIVESPAKVKTIKKFLGSNYDVQASNGHVRDFPKSQFGIDVENDFEPKYITIRGKGELLANLRKAAKKADKIYLATDPDREGEAISWHLMQALKEDPAKMRRISFNEITKTAVKASIKQPRDLDLNLVDAQQARRMLDRMVGYTISPLLWVKVKRGLSAGRVQSVALRIICDREEEINSFIPEEYWSLDGEFKIKGEKKPLQAKFYGTDKKLPVHNRAEMDKILKALENTEHTMYTDSDKIQDYLKNGKDDVRTKHKKNFDAGLRFAEDGTPDGASATDVDVEMSQYKNTTFQYNADKKTYAVGQFGTGYIDEANGNKQVEVTNVLVILTDISVVKESTKGHLSVSTTGTGTGYYISGGKYIPITWKKDSVTAPQRFYDQDGNELKLSVGKTFECMIDKSRDVKIDGKVLEKPADANENDNEVDKMALAD